MPFTVRVTNHKQSFVVDDNESVLDAALRQNFDIPHSCCEGICGSCEVQLVDGVVDYAHPENLVLDDTERTAGRALLCCARAQSDLLVHAPECTPPYAKALTQFEYQLLEMRQLTDEITQLFFQPCGKALAYLAGQYILVDIPNDEARPFSIANAPNSEHILELHIRCQQNNQPAQLLLETIKANQVIHFRGPLGHCFYHQSPAMPSVLLAVGTGFAPIKAILEEAFKKPLQHEVRLFWAGKSPNDLYQLELVQNWAKQIAQFSVTPILANALNHFHWTGEYGNIIDIVGDAYPTLAQHHIYFGGPMQLTIDGLDHFLERGAKSYFMYSDVFDLL